MCNNRRGFLFGYYSFVDNFLVQSNELIGMLLSTSSSVEPVLSITQCCFDSSVELAMVCLSNLYILLQLIDNTDMLQQNMFEKGGKVRIVILVQCEC